MKLVVANWKENPKTAEEAVAVARVEDAEGAVICPPFPFLDAVGRALKKSALGAQDVSYNEGGAHTGEVSTAQLAAFGVRYVIVGHSERREAGDTDEIVARKLEATLRAGLTPILCVGEGQRTVTMTNDDDRISFVRRQLESALGEGAPRRALLARGDNNARVIVAYEPVWAISSRSGSVPDTPERAAEMMREIRNFLGLRFTIHDLRVLYGGSVSAANARAFLELPEVDGVLVGGASLRPEEFGEIVRAAGEGDSRNTIRECSGKITN